MLPTFFHVQDFTWINFHLCLSIGLILTQPAVTGEHVTVSMDWNHNLNAVQEPASTHTFIGVANHEAVDLK